ncbi:MAG: hypothetical protein GY951_06810 [Psychromonas sp.]|nr:hypothetical protein [Alteromonadales bacterium]MCP5077754.1 hypothetical protein [Psychromonas sp.]
MFDKDRHFPCSNTEWNPELAKQTLLEIVAETQQQLQLNKPLPRYPLDQYSGKHLYMGSTGVLWAIHYLQQQAVVDTDFDISPYLKKPTKRKTRASLKNPHKDGASYLFGDLASLLLSYKLKPSDKLAQRIKQEIEVNNRQPVRELMWGTSGSMLVSNFMYQIEADKQWSELFISQSKQLIDSWQAVAPNTYLWDLELYNQNKTYLGAVHGFAGNVLPLIKGQQHLNKAVYQQVCDKTMHTVIQTAVTDNHYANWHAVYQASHSDTPTLLQHCHGAPGIVSSVSNIKAGLNAEFDDLLLKAGELIYHAGPLNKGSNLCHGTAGNGYALLKLFERSNDEIWLQRARFFAMDAITQYQQAKQQYGQLRYSLWTGDLGLAFYLLDCIKAQANFPSIDYF